MPLNPLVHPPDSTAHKEPPKSRFHFTRDPLVTCNTSKSWESFFNPSKIECDLTNGPLSKVRSSYDRYSGFFGVRETWVRPLGISWIFSIFFQVNQKHQKPKQLAILDMSPASMKNKSRKPVSVQAVV